MYHLPLHCLLPFCFLPLVCFPLFATDLDLASGIVVLDAGRTAPAYDRRVAAFLFQVHQTLS
jgi:hypothetical protein